MKLNNSNLKNILYRIIKTIIGLLIFSLGSSFAISANIGLIPWVALSVGIYNSTNLSYGLVHGSTGFLILIIDLFMHESIGIGTILDALLVGVFTEFFSIFFPTITDNIIISLLFMTIGISIISYGQFIYISTGLCSEPRDAFLVGLGKRFRQLSIGTVNTCLLICILFISFILNAPLGIGTIYSAIINGSIMNMIFKIEHFEPRNIRQHSLAESMKSLIK